MVAINDRPFDAKLIRKLGGLVFRPIEIAAAVAAANLSEQEHRVIQLHHGAHPLSLAEISERLDVSRARARQIERQGLAKIRVHLPRAEVRAKMRIAPRAKPTRPKPDPPSIPVEHLEMSVRSYNCLKRAGIHTLNDLRSWTRSQIAAIPQLGEKSLSDIEATLARHGAAFRS